MAQIEMDVSYENSDEDVVAAAARYRARATLVKRRGPGGGNPLWRFDGAAADLRRFIREWYALGDERLGDEQVELVGLGRLSAGGRPSTGRDSDRKTSRRRRAKRAAGREIAREWLKPGDQRSPSRGVLWHRAMWDAER